MPDGLLEEQRAESVVTIAGSVVGEDAFDPQVEAGVEGPCHLEEEDGRLVGLVGQDGPEADAAVIVDGDVRVLIAGAGRLARVIAVDPVARLDDAG